MKSLLVSDFLWRFRTSAKSREIYDLYFDADWYLRNRGDIKKHSERVPERRAAALRHYLSKGWRKGLDPSPYFDTAWYRDQTGARSVGEPLLHYATVGWREGLSPSPYFDLSWYLSRNSDVAAAGVEPLAHYMRHGWREGRSPCLYFDAPWYLNSNAVVAAAGAEPLADYLRYGWREGRDPNPFFHSDWYAKQAVLDGASQEPLAHYLAEGSKAGRRPNPNFDPENYRTRNPECATRGVEPLKHFLSSRDVTSQRPKRFGGSATQPRFAGPPPSGRAPKQAESFALSPSPLISIIIPNLNGAIHLPPLFESLRRQTYQNFEIVFIDDASTDDSIEIAKRYGAECIVPLTTRSGFAKANNLALVHCSGELIALLNNDMRVDPNWLEAMLAAMREDPLIAAVAPKIRFWSKFQHIIASSPQPFRLDQKTLVESLDYVKYFVAQGDEAEGKICSGLEGRESRIILRVPIQDEPLRFLFEGVAGQSLTIEAIGSVHRSIPGDDPHEHLIVFSDAARRESYYVINNAGSAVDQNGAPYDRGFGHIDDGEFDRPEDIELLCGGAALIRRDALHGRELFISEFVAYYEDSELSHRLHDTGYRIVYRPSAIAYHRHSATTLEKSLFWRVQTQRNKILYHYATAASERRAEILEQGKLHLNHLMHWGRNAAEANDVDKAFSDQVPQINGDLNRIVALIDAGSVPRRAGLRIGVFNSYWKTLGGGEAHALDVAVALMSFGQVELISDDDFELDPLLRYFGHSDARGLRKRRLSSLTPAATRDYDIFVNASYQNEIPSLAAKSFFLVSFPSQTPTRKYLESYRFLANSRYTADHMRVFWGPDGYRSSIIHPAAADAYFIDRAELAHKEKIILSVGRFTSAGHTKNQIEIVEAFRRLNEKRGARLNDWRLTLAGTVNDPAYFAEVARASAGLNVELAVDVDFDRLLRLYRSARIYVHASGYGRDSTTEPELFEHFGLAVAQALASGCYPLVFDAAGPREIVETVGVGELFRTIDDLVEILDRVIGGSERHGPKAFSIPAVEAAERFSRERQRYAIERLLLYET